MLKQIAILTTFLLTLAGVAQAAPRLSFDPVKGSGETVTLQVTLTSDGAQLAALGANIGYDITALEYQTVTAGTAAIAAKKDVKISSPSPGMLRLGILGVNSSSIGNGIVAVMTFSKKLGANPKKLEFKYSVSGADQAGEAVKVGVSKPDPLSH